MTLKAIYDSKEEIPEQYQELFTERDGKWELTGVSGMKTQADVERLQGALEKERNDHRETKSKLREWGDLDHDEVMAELDKIEEYKTTAEGKIDDAKVDEIVESRIKSRLGPVERKLQKAQEELEEKGAKIEEYKAADNRRTIHDNVRKAATSNKLLDTAIEDALVLAERVFQIDEEGRVVTKENVGVTPGIDPEAWLSEIQPNRPHWWPQSRGGGGRGGTGQGFPKNPWSKDHWNLTEQGRVVREHGMERAKQMASAAGSDIGATKPK